MIAIVWGDWLGEGRGGEGIQIERSIQHVCDGRLLKGRGGRWGGGGGVASAGSSWPLQVIIRGSSIISSSSSSRAAIITALEDAKGPCNEVL